MLFNELFEWKKRICTKFVLFKYVKHVSILRIQKKNALSKMSLAVSSNWNRIFIFEGLAHDRVPHDCAATTTARFIAINEFRKKLSTKLRTILRPTFDCSIFSFLAHSRWICLFDFIGVLPIKEPQFVQFTAKRNWNLFYFIGKKRKEIEWVFSENGRGKEKKKKKNWVHTL